MVENYIYYTYYTYYTYYSYFFGINRILNKKMKHINI